MNKIKQFKQDRPKVFWAAIVVIAIIVILGIKNTMSSGNPFSSGPSAESVIKKDASKNTVWKVSDSADDDFDGTYVVFKTDGTYYASNDPEEFSTDDTEDYKADGNTVTMEQHSEDDKKFTDLQVDGNNISGKDNGKGKVTFKQVGKLSSDND